MLSELLLTAKVLSQPSMGRLAVEIIYNVFSTEYSVLLLKA